MTPFPELHVVTDDAILARSDIVEAARAVLRVGPGIALHLRGHGTTARRIHALAHALLPDARSTDARLLVNDRVDIALAVGVDGVQLSGGSLLPADVRTFWPDAWIGVSAHPGDPPEDGTDFVLLGTIYATPSHPGRAPAGPSAIADAARAWRRPIVAIGGIDRGGIEAVAAAGAAGIAVVRAVWHASDPGAAARALLEHWRRTRE